MADRVSFNQPYVGACARRYLELSLAGEHHAGDGPWTLRASEALRELAGHRHVLLTTSGTHALELACMALGLGHGDEVIVPSFTFTSTATAAARMGAVIRFADVDRDSLSITPETVAPILTHRTRAIITVHYAGIADRPDELAELARSHSSALIEDNAHGLGGQWKGRSLGSFGCMSALSFHETKNLSCGEGGALGINDDDLLLTCEIAREKGTNRSQFFRGEVDRYTWIGPGSSFLPSDILAAMLTGQVEDFPVTQRRRHAVWTTYERGLGAWAESQGFRLPQVPDEAGHPAHLFYLIAPDAPTRERFSAHLAEHGVQAPFHYQPLHSSPGGRAASGGHQDHCPITTDISGRLVRLPLFAGLSDDQVERVLSATRSFGG